MNDVIQAMILFSIFLWGHIIGEKLDEIIKELNGKEE